MVMKVEPIFEALREIKKKGHVVMLAPRGKPFNQKLAKSLSKKPHLIFLCGHYEGVDERVHEHLADEEISIGDFVTTGGEFPALCMIDAIIRWVPGVLGNQDSLHSESFSNGQLDFPQYTKPRDFEGWKVPEVLFSGDHRAINEWRAEQALKLTKKHRPDLLASKK
jgi:tRNA (guanine37-N1)-methyltransferase